MAWLLTVASACAAPPDLDFGRIDLPRDAPARDARFIPRVRDLPRIPPAAADADRVMCWESDHVNWLFTSSLSEPALMSVLCRADSPAGARGVLHGMRERYVDPNEWIGLLPSEPGLTYVAVADHEREDAESWGADAVAGEKRVGNVRLERKGRHVLLFECRGLWMPPTELESFLAPFLSHMEEWPSEETAPAASGR